MIIINDLFILNDIQVSIIRYLIFSVEFVCDWFFFRYRWNRTRMKEINKKKKCWNPSLKMPIICVSHLRYLFPKHSSISAFVFFISSLCFFSISFIIIHFTFRLPFQLFCYLLDSVLESFCIFVLFFFISSNFSLKSKENSRHRREHNNKNRFDTHIIVMIGVQWFINDQIDWIMLHRFFFSSFQYVSFFFLVCFL